MHYLERNLPFVRAEKYRKCVYGAFLLSALYSEYERFRRKVVEWIKVFNGDFVLQTMFLRSPEFDLSDEGQLSAWMDIVREIKPREIMVYTIDRETPDKSLGKYTVDEMRSFVAPLVDEGYKIQIRG